MVEVAECLMLNHTDTNESATVIPSPFQKIEQVSLNLPVLSFLQDWGTIALISAMTSLLPLNH